MMNRSRSEMAAVLATTVLCALPVVAGAADSSAAGGSEPHADDLSEIVITATRREDTVHNVPLSVLAVANANLEAQSVRAIQDLSRTVPSLKVDQSTNFTGTQNYVSIRGIRSVAGAATTGIYMDDVPLAQRTLTQPGAGFPMPQVFDVERLEVLRGPQGTLYGASSEGGTVRFITTQPNFSNYSGEVTAEAAQVQHGGQNYEGGMSFGGPIIKDELAFRVSAWKRQDGGYIDHVSRFTGDVVGEDTNGQDHSSLHGQLAWKPTDRSKVAFSYYYSDNQRNDSDLFYFNVPNYSATVGPPNAPTTYTYGPYNVYGPYKSGVNTLIGDNFYQSDAQIKPSLNTSSDYLKLPSLVFDYDFDRVSIKLVSSYVDYKVRSNGDLADAYALVTTAPDLGINSPTNSSYIANLPSFDVRVPEYGTDKSWTEELRFTSRDSDSRLSWVAGLYFNRTDVQTQGSATGNYTDLANALFGGVGTSTPPEMLFVYLETVNEKQIAGFGELTYKITDKLNVTGGLRVTRDELNSDLQEGGIFFGFPTNDLADLARGKASETPVTPKFGMQYVINSNSNLYISAAKGFRSGGSNQPVVGPGCEEALAAIGYPNGNPLSYKSDSLWSYELGSKNRLWDGRATLNASIYRIDWKNVQTNITTGCPLSFIANAGAVVSQGFDMDASVRVLPGLTLSASLAYDDAKYKDDVLGAPTVLLVGKDDRVPYTPMWSGNVTGEYSFAIFSTPSYVRLDYQFQSSVVQEGGGPHTATYYPDMYNLPGTTYLSARAGVNIYKTDIALFVDNLTGSTDLLSKVGGAYAYGRSACVDLPACTNYGLYTPVGAGTTFRPRTFGIRASYRF